MELCSYITNYMCKNNLTYIHMLYYFLKQIFAQRLFVNRRVTKAIFDLSTFSRYFGTCKSMKMSYFISTATFIALIQAEGSCPPTLSVDKCEAHCGPSLPCNGTQLCCPTACGGAMCVDAMTQRHFVNLGM